MTAIPNTRIEKSLRLLKDNRVTEVQNCRVFLVESFSGRTYGVVIGEGTMRACECRWDGEGACSHVLACNAYINRARFADDVLAGLPDLDHPNGRPLKSV